MKFKFVEQLELRKHNFMMCVFLIQQFIFSSVNVFHNRIMETRSWLVKARESNSNTFVHYDFQYKIIKYILCGLAR